MPIQDHIADFAGPVTPLDDKEEALIKTMREREAHGLNPFTGEPMETTNP